MNDREREIERARLMLRACIPEDNVEVGAYWMGYLTGLRWEPEPDEDDAEE